MKENITATVNIPQVMSEQPKQNHFLIILLSILLLVSCVIAGFFAYQTQKLVKELTVYRLQPTETPIPSPTPDPTADWNIYLNKEKGYSIKFPKTGFLQLICPDEELTVTNRGTSNQISPVQMSTCARGGKYTLETKTYPTIQGESEETKYYNIVKKDIILGNIAGKLYTYTFTNIEEGPFPEWYTIAKVNKNNKTYEIWFDDKDSVEIFDQILSTFKFIN